MTWNQETRNQVEILWAQRRTFDEINVLLPHVPKKTIYRWVSQLKQKGNLNPFKGAKKPPKYNERDKRALKVAASRNPEESIAGIARIADFDGCHQTTVKYLKTFGFKSIVRAKVPKLKPHQVQARLRFVDLHLHQDLEYWKSWTFSDESSFHLDCSKGVKRIVIRKNERYLPNNVQGKSQAGGGKLMIWSHISWDGIGPLLFIYGGIDANLYMQILNETVLPHLLERLGDTGARQRYQDDGASCHDAQAVIDFCAEKGIDRPFWPPNSPDMNPIEYVWGWVNNKLAAMADQPQTLQELEEVLTKFWDEISLESVRNLYRGMPHRIEALRKARGWNTSL